MSEYTVGEIVIWLLLAAALGFVLGWLLRELRFRVAQRPDRTPPARVTEAPDPVATEESPAADIPATKPAPAKKAPAKQAAAKKAPAKKSTAKKAPAKQAAAKKAPARKAAAKKTPAERIPPEPTLPGTQDDS